MNMKASHLHAPSLSNDALRSLLAHAGLRATAPRMAILVALARAHMPLSIDDLHARVGARADRVTLYRNLHELAKRGVVYQCDFRTGKAFFELQAKAHHHHHVVCTSCGHLEPVEVCFSDIEKKALKGTRSFAAIESHSLELFGTCRACRKH